MAQPIQIVEEPMSATSMMRNTCTVTHAANTQAATGAVIKTYGGSVDLLVQCSVQINGGDERNFQQRLQGERQLSVFFPPGTNVSAGDRLTTIAGVSGITSSEVFEVTSPPQDHAGRGAYVMVTATEMNS